MSYSADFVMRPASRPGPDRTLRMAPCPAIVPATHRVLGALDSGARCMSPGVRQGTSPYPRTRWLLTAGGLDHLQID